MGLLEYAVCVVLAVFLCYCTTLVLGYSQKELKTIKETVIEQLVIHIRYMYSENKTEEEAIQFCKSYADTIYKVYTKLSIGFIQPTQIENICDEIIATMKSHVKDTWSKPKDYF